MARNTLKPLKPFIEFSLCCGGKANVLMRHNSYINLQTCTFKRLKTTKK